MKGISIILGILLGLKNIGSSTGVIDVSEFRSSKLFSGPTKIGEALFYKYVCKDNGSYSKVFDRSYQIFPIRAHTRLVNLVLGLKEDRPELIQVMYSDVRKDYRTNNLYYSKKDGSWKLVDIDTYKSELKTLKNNLLTFDIRKPQNKHFEKLKDSNLEGFNSYVPEKGYEIEKVKFGHTTLWERLPNYEFKSLELNEKLQGPDKLILKYSNYYSEVSQHYKKNREIWTFELTERVVDLLSLSTHGWQRKKEEKEKKPEGRESYHKLLLEGEKDFENETVSLLASEILDLKNNPLERFTINLNFDKSKENVLTTNYFKLYEVNSYEFFKLSGCRIESIAYDQKPIWEFNKEDEEKFHHFRISYVEGYPVLLFSLTKVKPKGNCDPFKDNCKGSPYKYSNTFYKKSEKGWICLKRIGFLSELNKMLDSASKLKNKRTMKSSPVPLKLTPLTPSLNYGKRETFTYDLNIPDYQKFTREMLSIQPELIMMKVRPQYALNVVVDGSNVLWEQKESGAGCLIIYIYKSETELMAHLVTDSKSEPHLFFKYTVNMWFPVTKKEYESSRVFYKGKLNFFRRRKGPVNEYIVPEYPQETLSEPRESDLNTNLENSKHTNRKSETQEL